MASRFVRGWKVSVRDLQGIVGTGQFTVEEVLASKLNKRILRDVFMSLGEGDSKEEIAQGKEMAMDALQDVLAGKLVPAKGYSYARVTELVLNHVARPVSKSEGAEIELAATYYLNNNEFGRWNPLLKGCGLPSLARLWASNNFSFPWRSGKSRTDWPAWTVFDPRAIATVGREMTGLTQDKLREIRNEALSEDIQHVEAAREELWIGLQRLRKWIRVAGEPEENPRLCCAETGNSLVLLMDGDQ